MTKQTLIYWFNYESLPFLSPKKTENRILSAIGTLSNMTGLRIIALPTIGKDRIETLKTKVLYQDPVESPVEYPAEYPPEDPTNGTQDGCPGVRCEGFNIADKIISAVEQYENDIKDFTTEECRKGDIATSTEPTKSVKTTESDEDIPNGLDGLLDFILGSMRRK